MQGEELDITQLTEMLSGSSLSVIEDVAPGDGMHEYAPELYAEAGQKALRCIRLAMIAAQLESVDNILDFACGAGRVMRYLRAAFPDAAMTGCDVLDYQVDFVSRNVRSDLGWLGKLTREQIDLPGPYDLIWSGSLLTHIGGDRWMRFIKTFESLLAPGGIVVFTVYGRHVVDEVRRGENMLGMTPDQVKEILKQYDATGFGFQVTPPFPPQGDAFVSPAWFCSQLEEVPNLELLLYSEHAWLGQDVIACLKARV